MSWVEIQIQTTAEQAEPLSDQLMEFGAVAVTFQDGGNHPIYEPAPETPRLWQETIVTGLFKSQHPIHPVIQFLENFPSQFTFKTVALEDEDWERRCLDSFKPIPISSRLWVCPSWQRPPFPNAINIILDPGLAFGTGTHATTQLCLKWLDDNIKSAELVIDYGCGSGILGIAALKLGAKEVIAIDNDPQALEATKMNSERNKVSEKLFVQSPDAPIKGLADILIANILAQPLIELAPYFATLVKPGGKIVLSGILKEQFKAVKIVYNAFFTLSKPINKEEWIRLEGMRCIKT